MALIAVVAAFYLSREKSFDWRVFRDSVLSLDRRWLAASLVFSYATYLVRALRWRVLLEPLQPRTPLGPLLSATLIGFSATTVLGRAGEMIRPYLIATRSNVPFPSQVAAWIVERLYDILIALAVFGIALLQVRHSMAAAGPVLAWTMEVGGFVIAAGAAFSLAVLLMMKYRSVQIQGWLLRSLGFLAAHHLTRAEKMIAGFVDGIQSTKSQSATIHLILYTCLEWLLVAACYACV